MEAQSQRKVEVFTHSRLSVVEFTTTLPRGRRSGAGRGGGGCVGVWAWGARCGRRGAPPPKRPQCSTNDERTDIGGVANARW